MANIKLSVVADVMPPLEKRIRAFARDALSGAIIKVPMDVETIQLGLQHGLIHELVCDDSNRSKWEHLPVNAGDKVFQFVEGMD